MALLLLGTRAVSQNIEVVGQPSSEDGPFYVDGIVLDVTSAEPLIGANVLVDEIKDGTITDKNGKFLLRLDKGYFTFKISYIGYEPREIRVLVRGDGIIQVLLKEDLLQMDEVIIRSSRPDVNVKGVTLGKTSLSIESIEALPPFVGELDVLKSITLLPGISTVGEASSGFNVRGGGSDQNLILLDRAPLYNPSHLFGFFSAFNSDVINDVTIYKGGIPAKYGGRGSSIIDLTYKVGDLNEWSGKASLGLISTRFALDGPIIDNKLSIMIAGRTSYSDWLLRSVSDPDVSNSSASFYDANGILGYSLNDNNSFKYSFYISQDDFKFVNDTSYVWGNTNHVFDWDHTFNPRLNLNLSLVRTEYDFAIRNRSGINDFDIESKVLDQGLNLDFSFELTDNQHLTFGAQTKYLQITPGTLSPVGSSSAVLPFEVEREQGLESGLYFQHNVDLGEKIGFSYGLRYSQFMFLGDKTVNTYEQYAPRKEENISEQTAYGSNEIITTYEGLEPRVSFRYSLDDQSSIKMGYNRINQYIHLISNTTTIAPTDIWKLSDPFLKPQTVTQYSIGFFRNFKNNTIETSVEAYYKEQDNIIEYKDGADLVLNPHLETELLNGLGNAYGIEVYFRRKTGFLRGWVSYTYSRSLRQVVGSFPEELINGGRWFPSNFDKPHDLTATLEVALNPDTRFSSILTYSTGRAVTFPVAKFAYFGEEIAYFEDRNSRRAPDYMRIDVSWTFSLNGRKKWSQGDLVLSVFNLLGRKNAFSVFFDDVEGAPPEAYKLSILGIPFPTMSYSFSF